MFENSNNFLPLLITGCAGVPGYNAFRFFASRYPPGQVIGIRATQTWKLKQDFIYPLDIEDESQMLRLFSEHRFQSILDCSGSCALKICEINPTHAEKINIAGLHSLLKARQCYAPDSRLIRLSSDLVFSGEKCGNYQETDPPDPVTVYGKTMATAEEILLEESPESLILRISLPMGESFNGHAGAIDWIENRFKKNRPATLYFDEIRTPTYTKDMELAYLYLLSSSLAGVFHFGGETCLSLYEIAQIINKVGGYPAELLKGCLRFEAGPLPPRAGNVAMNSQKLYTVFGKNPFRPWPHHSSFLPTHRDWHRERFSDEQGSRQWVIEHLY